MNKHHIASLASKLLGIFLAVRSLSYLSGLATRLRYPDGAQGYASPTLTYTLDLACFAISLGIGLLLIFRAEKASAFLVGRSETAGESSPVTPRHLQSIAFSVVGLFLALQALPRFFYLFLVLWGSLQGWLYRPNVNGYTYIELLTSTLQLALGTWLLLGASGIATLVNKLRGLPLE